jgi:hypothetical protein
VRLSCGEVAHALHYDGKTISGPWVKFASADTLEGTVVPGGYPKSRLRRAGMRCGKPGREAVTSGCC